MVARGSASLTRDSSSGTLARQWYSPYGGVRLTEGTLPTDYAFTGQKQDGHGLLFYQARYYDAALGRFAQADSIVPDPYNPQDLNRYTYTRNNPVRYTDPKGRFPWLLVGVLVVFLLQPGDTGPYPPDPTGDAVVDLTLRITFEPYDRVRTGSDCLSGQCGALDALSFLPLVPGGLSMVDDLLDSSKAAGAISKLDDVPLKKGGRYKDIDAAGGERNHIPAKSVSPLAADDGPAIRMEPLDHRATASWGGSKAAQEYRQQQRQLIEQACMDDAIQVDIDDIRKKFGDKYDDGILQMIDSLDEDIYNC